MVVLSIVFWSFALYGAWMLMRQSLHAFMRKTTPGAVLTVVLIVQNCEDEIEGVLRALLSRAGARHADRRIVVMDVNSTDGTALIVETLARRHMELSYVRTESESELAACLQRVVSGTPAAYVLNGRHARSLRELAARLAWLDG